MRRASGASIFHRSGGRLAGGVKARPGLVQQQRVGLQAVLVLPPGRPQAREHRVGHGRVDAYRTRLALPGGRLPNLKRIKLQRCEAVENRSISNASWWLATSARAPRMASCQAWA